MPFMYDPMFLLVMLPCMALAGIASMLVKSTFTKYAKVPAYSGMTGAKAAAQMLRSNGVNDVRIEQTRGFLSDHYDPTSKTLRLSPDVYRSNSLSAVGVACHEAGHALQHATHYAPLKFRSAMVPITSFSSNFSFIVFFVGLLLNSMMIVKIGCAMFGIAFLFTVVTLPVEWDASRRAKSHLVSASIVSPNQAAQAGSVLNAAFLTYVASAVTALATLLYYLYRAGLLGGGRSND